DAPGDSVVLPCAHGGFCITCISAIKQSGCPYCPQCRKLIDRAVRLEEISDRVAKYRFSSLLMTTAAADADPHSSAASSSTKRSVSSMATAPDVAPLTKLYDLQKRRQRA
ncbi:hypothetical protein FOZ62_006394, partial [Perkinsus olseni]